MNLFYLNVASQVKQRVSLEKLKGKRVLITGANGILGSHIAALLAYLNNEFSFDMKVLNVSRSAPASWLEDIFKTKGFAFREMDLGEEPVKFKEDFDFIIHAATYGQPKKFIENAATTMCLNSTVTESLLRIAERSGATFLFMSTSEIYGNPSPEYCPTSELAPAVIHSSDIRASYNVSKVFSEVLCNLYNETGRVRARVARVSSVYGPGVRLNDDRVLYVFIKRALETGELRLMDQGMQRRKWCYITDAMVMFFHILLHSTSVIYNVCGSGIYSIAEIAQSIGSQLNKPVYFPDKESFQEHTKGSLNLIDLDNTKILKEAKMQKLIEPEQGIVDCIAWIKWLMEQKLS